MPQTREVRCSRCDNIFKSSVCRAVCPSCRYQHACGEAEIIINTKDGKKVVQVPGGGFKEI